MSGALLGIKHGTLDLKLATRRGRGMKPEAWLLEVRFEGHEWRRYNIYTDEKQAWDVLNKHTGDGIDGRVTPLFPVEQIGWYHPFSMRVRWGVENTARNWKPLFTSNT